MLIGLSPVKMRASYKKPPNVQPMNGAIIGTYKMVREESRLGRGRAFPAAAYPEVIIASSPNFIAISNEICE